MCGRVLSQSVVSDSAALRAIACQAPVSVEFPRQEYWGGLPFPTPGDFPDPGIEPESLVSPAMAWILCHCTTWEAHREVILQQDKVHT